MPWKTLELLHEAPSAALQYEYVDPFQPPWHFPSTSSDAKNEVKRVARTALVETVAEKQLANIVTVRSDGGRGHYQARVTAVARRKLVAANERVVGSE